MRDYVLSNLLKVDPVNLTNPIRVDFTAHNERDAYDVEDLVSSEYGLIRKSAPPGFFMSRVDPVVSQLARNAVHNGCLHSTIELYVGPGGVAVSYCDGSNFYKASFVGDVERRIRGFAKRHKSDPEKYQESGFAKILDATGDFIFDSGKVWFFIFQTLALKDAPEKSSEKVSAEQPACAPVTQ